MIKNTLIILLTLSVIGLSWMAFSDTSVKKSLLSQIQERVVAFKKAPVVGKEKGEPPASASDSGTGIHQRRESKKPAVDGPKSPVIERGISYEESQSHKETAQGEAAAEILNKRPREKKKSWLSSDELASVLSILKSARDLLGKTTFHIRPKEGVTGDRNTGLDEKIIKKKSANGPERSG